MEWEKFLSKVLMVHIIKELIKNKIFLVRVVNKWNLIISPINPQYKSEYNFTLYVYKK